MDSGIRGCTVLPFRVSLSLYIHMQIRVCRGMQQVEALASPWNL